MARSTRYLPQLTQLDCLAECSLGILPLGTANDFAHSAGVPIKDLTAALRLAASAPRRSIDVGFVNGRLFVNLVSGGFGSRVTVETDPKLKQRLGGLAYAITGISHFAELSENRGIFRAEEFSWEGHFLAVAIGNGRQAGGGISLCPNALIDDGLLDLMVLPAMDRAARLESFLGFAAARCARHSCQTGYEAKLLDRVRIRA